LKREELNRMMMFVRDCNVTLDTEGIDFLLRHSIKIKEVQDAEEARKRAESAAAAARRRRS
jgi:hypothetical protein